MNFLHLERCSWPPSSPLEGSQNRSQNIDQILEIEGVTPHIYGKKETRPFRKMGHVTIIHPKIDTARKMAKQVKETLSVISK